MWTWLKGSYRNLGFLLQNILLSIDKVSGVGQYKNNLEKLSSVLASLVNIMQDLSTIGKNHEL